MKFGRSFIRDHAKGKNILNLFSYTCSFSVAAIEGGATSVVNVDMNKNVLTIGRENHRLNGLDTKKVQFMPYNILKSWSRIKKAGPYDLIIIDPPSFQKGSFAATSDYAKIIRRLHEFAATECTVLAALNAPELDTLFIKELFLENAPEFSYIKRLGNLESFPANDEERSLKNLIFKKGYTS
jgi:23S rRNA (cytosine1962-C5)-methyltransferase